MKKLIENNPVLISFSGGKTSAFMLRYLTMKYLDKQFLVVFCNTGKEREETLEFVERCGKAWNINIIWLEAVIRGEKGTRGANSYKIVSFETAARNGEPFEAMVKKYGLPSIKTPYCTRELKKRTILRYLSDIGAGTVYQAIGIRKDEENRVNRDTAIKERKIYPLIDELQVNKHFINSWWSRQSFTLQLKEHEGNCDLCFKKSDRKLFTLMNDNPELLQWWADIERKYSRPMQSLFRKGRTLVEMMEQAKEPFVRFEESKQAALFDPELDIEFDCLCKST